MSGFTPAPWVVNPFVAQVDCQRLSEKGGLVPVCQMLWPTDERSEDETEANARLIAAAPRLYAALEALCNGMDGLDRAANPETYADGLAALAEARGESVSA